MRRSALLLLSLLATQVACGGDETTPEDHMPSSAQLFGPAGELTPNLALPRGEAIRIEVRFYDDAGDLIDGLEPEHGAALTFAPASLASVAEVSGRTMAFDVTAPNAAGTGTVQVGFGHGTDRSELTFGPFAVTVP